MYTQFGKIWHILVELKIIVFNNFRNLNLKISFLSNYPTSIIEKFFCVNKNFQGGFPLFFGLPQVFQFTTNNTCICTKTRVSKHLCTHTSRFEGYKFLLSAPVCQYIVIISHKVFCSMESRKERTPLALLSHNFL